MTSAPVLAWRSVTSWSWLEAFIWGGHEATHVTTAHVNGLRLTTARTGSSGVTSFPEGLLLLLSRCGGSALCSGMGGGLTCGSCHRVQRRDTHLKKVTKNCTKSMMLLCWEKAIWKKKRRHNKDVERHKRYIPPRLAWSHVSLLATNTSRDNCGQFFCPLRPTLTLCWWNFYQTPPGMHLTRVCACARESRHPWGL